MTHRRARLRRKIKRYIRRTAHFIGFLIYWAVALALGEAAMFCVMFLCIKLS